MAAIPDFPGRLGWRIVGPVAGIMTRQEPRHPERQRAAIDGDTVIRILTAVVVLAVAAFAAIVSYSHIFDLGRHHGQDGTAARLLPLSVDGLIASASLVMLHAARNDIKLHKLSLPRAMLGLGVGATVAANVEYGLPFGWLSAVVSAWPAVAFVGSVEMAVRFVRNTRHAAAADDEADSGQGDDSDPPPDDEDDRRNGDQDGGKPKPSPRNPRPSGHARALAILRRNPVLSDAVIARRAKVSERTVQRARETLKKENADHA